MKCSILAAAALVALATPTFAGGPAVVAADPVPMAAAAPAPALADWSGLYAGLGYGRGSGDMVFTPGSAFDLESGSATSAFVGYLWQRNSLVYGGELAYTSLNDVVPTGFDDEVSRSIDLKGRIGFAANRALFYGVLGYSMASYDEGDGDWDPSGINYGLGVDFLATNRLTVGLEYLARDLTGDNPNPLLVDQEVDINLDTISLRVGFKF